MYILPPNMTLEEGISQEIEMCSVFRYTCENLVELEKAVETLLSACVLKALVFPNFHSRFY